MVDVPVVCSVCQREYRRTRIARIAKVPAHLAAVCDGCKVPSVVRIKRPLRLTARRVEARDPDGGVSERGAGGGVAGAAVVWREPPRRRSRSKCTLATRERKEAASRPAGGAPALEDAGLPQRSCVSGVD